ncbi:hypothetical protein TWF506_009043 [Arthrobotrys conoides]|uniref:Uncharacterized protein n=1 Tax=Arthrobotrys conoides TaxID=74498 RepID=A0AAN8RM16_9PEZI
MPNLETSLTLSKVIHMAQEAVQEHENGNPTDDATGTPVSVCVNLNCGLRSIPNGDINAKLRDHINAFTPEFQYIRSLPNSQEVFITRQTLCQGLRAGAYALLMCNVGLHLSLCTGVAQMVNIGSLLKEYLSYPTVRQRHRVGPSLRGCLQEVLSAQPDRIDLILQATDGPTAQQVPAILSSLALDFLHTGLSMKQHRFLFACPEITGISNVIALGLAGSLCLSVVGEIFALATTRCLEYAPYSCNNPPSSGTAIGGETGVARGTLPIHQLPPVRGVLAPETPNISLELRCRTIEIRILYFHPDRPGPGNPPVPPPTVLPNPAFEFNKVSSWLSPWSRYQTLPDGRSFVPPDGYNEGNIDIIRVFI